MMVLSQLVAFAVCVAVMGSFTSADSDSEPLPGSANVCTRQVWQGQVTLAVVEVSCCVYYDVPCSSCSHRCRTSTPTRVARSGQCFEIRREVCQVIRQICVGSYVTERYCCSGYQLDDTGSCKPIVNCMNNNGGCSDLCLYDETSDSSMCGCFDGYQLQDGTRCVDVNECLVNNGGCDQTCQNMNGTSWCSCQHGYELISPTHCQQINECEMENGGCEHECIDTDGDSYCECRDGYELVEGFECEDINECELYRDPCDPSAECVNTVGSYDCVCPPGMELAGPENRTCEFTDAGFEQDGANLNPDNTDEPPLFLKNTDKDLEEGAGAGSLGLPVGAALGGLVALLLLLLLLLLLYKRRRGAYPWTRSNSGSDAPPSRDSFEVPVCHTIPPVVIGIKPGKELGIPVVTTPPTKRPPGYTKLKTGYNNHVYNEMVKDNPIMANMVAELNKNNTERTEPGTSQDANQYSEIEPTEDTLYENFGYDDGGDVPEDNVEPLYGNINPETGRPDVAPVSISVKAPSVPIVNVDHSGELETLRSNLKKVTKPNEYV